MRERLNLLRKELNLSQDEFGSRIGLTKASISRLENGSNNFTEQTIISICREFNVNREWLETGNGEMFITLTRDEQIAAWVGKCLADQSAETQIRILKILSQLPPTYWEVFADFGRRMAEEFSSKENEES